MHRRKEVEEWWLKRKERWIDEEEGWLQGRKEEEWWLKVKERWFDGEEEGYTDGEKKRNCV